MKTLKVSETTENSNTGSNSNHGALIVMCLVMMVTLFTSNHAAAWLTAVDDQGWHQDSYKITEVSEDEDEFGQAVATGDFNGDDYMDLAVGVPGEDGEKGGVNIIYGSPNNLTWRGYTIGWGGYSNDNRFIQQDTYCGGWADNAYGDRFGHSLTAGDFNNDGVDDLAIGSPYRNTNGKSNAGAVTVIYGIKKWGFFTDYWLARGFQPNMCQVWHQGTHNIFGAVEAEDLFGFSLAAGDFDNDGKDDLAIGVPGEDYYRTDDGVVNVIYGKYLEGLHEDDNHGLSQNGREDGDQFGYTLAVGNFNGDNYDDLAVGVPYEDVYGSSVIDAGAVNIYYGTHSHGLSGGKSQLWYQDNLKLNVSSEKDDTFGWSLAVGNFDGDKYDDLAIGVPGEDISSNSIINAGLVNVLYGTTYGLSEDGAQEWHQNSPGIGGKAEKNDQFGFSLAAGNFNGDKNDNTGNPVDDLAIGVPYERYERGCEQGFLPWDCKPLWHYWDAGAINVLYGTSEGLDESESDIWDQDTEDWRTGKQVVGVAEEDDTFGSSLATGDFDNDGYTDLVVGVPGEDDGEGSVNVFYGSYDYRSYYSATGN